nr:tetratricopeptide repeat protein [Acidobacteriota bacterium]
MALDREDTLKKADKLVRQGRLDAAIAEYLRVVEDQPRDWNTANTLGDLYVRAKQADMAVAQYARIAEHFFHDGFYPKAAALYKKILKLSPDHEHSQLQLADLSAKQ